MGVKKKKGKILVKVDDLVQELRELLNQYLPEVQDDRVIQIGSTIKKYGETDCYLKHIICLNETKNISNKTLIDFEYTGVELPKKELKSANKKFPGITNPKELNAAILKERMKKQKVVKKIT